MGLFDRLSGEFIDIIEWLDDSRDTIVWPLAVFAIPGSPLLGSIPIRRASPAPMETMEAPVSTRKRTLEPLMFPVE